MRVLFVNRMLSIERGGGETFDLEISRHLEKLGCEISHLSGIPVFSGARIQPQHPRSHMIRSPYFGWFPWDKIKGGWRLRMLDFALFEREAAKWAAAHVGEFDVIQVCELPTFVMEWKNLRMPPPVVMRLTAPDYYDASGAIKLANAVIASGATMAAVAKESRPDCADIPNGVDTEMFYPHHSTFRAAHGIATVDFVILFVARFQSVKNHAMLVRAFSKFLPSRPDAKLVFAGSGPLESEIRKNCDALGVTKSVMFLGEVAFKDLPDIYAAADLKVIASDYESFCFAALEAMATALPLVVTDTDWVPKLIGGGEGGRIVPKRNADAMCSAMSELAARPDLRAKMGRWNREHVIADYGWESSARKLHSLYNRLCNSSLCP